MEIEYETIDGEEIAFECYECLECLDKGCKACREGTTAMENEYKVGDRVTFQEPGEDEIFHGTVVSIDSHEEITVRFDGESGVEELFNSEVEREN